jgi:spermidine synthase
MILLLVGLLAIVSQVVLLRELSVAFYGVELAYALALAAWMAGGAAGALLRLRRVSPAGRAATWLLVASAVLLPVNVAWIRASRVVLGGIPGAYLPFQDQLLVLLVSVLPQAAILGLAFRWAAEDAAASGASLARSYAVESAGACLGAGAATLGFLAGLQTFTLAVLAAGVVPATLAASIARRRGPHVRGAMAQDVIPVAIAALTVGAAWAAPRLDLAMTAWTHPAVIESRDSPYARITATRAGSQVALFVDDVLVHESESVQQEELAHVAALAHPAPRRILVLGGSVSGIDRELAKHAPEQLVTVEADRVFVEIGRRLARSSEVVVDDPRQFLQFNRVELQSVKFNPMEYPGAFDLIVIAMPQPTSGQSNRFYTREFLDECRGRLRPGGVVALRLDLPENVVSPLVAMRTASIVEAARAVFRSVQVLHGASAIVFGSPATLPTDPSVMVDRWHQRRLSVRLVTPAYLHYLWENDRRVELEHLVQTARAVPNSDTRPVCYQVAAIGWLAKFFPALLTLEPSAGAAAGPLALLGAIAAALLLLSARSARASRGAQAAVAGFSGMLLETVLLLAYQARSGALYERLGLLLLAFMLGLAIGAAVVGRLVVRGIRGPRPVAGRIAAAVYVALALLGAAVAVIVANGVATGLWGTAVLMLAAGGLTAGVFACVSVEPGGGSQAIGQFYAADLAGGAAGSLLAGMVLVPSVGLAPTAWIVCGAAVAGLLVSWRAYLPSR